MNYAGLTNEISADYPFGLEVAIVGNFMNRTFKPFLSEQTR
jgi:hypothetical protein